MSLYKGDILLIFSHKNHVIRYELKGAVLTVGAHVWIDFDESRCTGCAWCVDVCSEKVFSIKKVQFNNHSEKKVKINIENCINYGNCVDVCKPKGIVDHSYNHIQSYLKTQLASNNNNFFDEIYK